MLPGNAADGGEHLAVAGASVIFLKAPAYLPTALA